MQAARIIWQTSSTQDPCPLCNNGQDNQIILQSQHFLAERGYLDLVKCSVCESTWFPEATSKNVSYPPVEQALQDPNFIYLIHHYLEIVNGLNWKVPMLERLPFEQFNSVLEIGCNAGVALDYCRTLWPAKQVVGLEPSAYGVLGSKLLELPILACYLAEASSLKSKVFDFIYATEVLEHVADPVQFLQELKAHLSPNGMILLTTPRAEILQPKTAPGELYAALSTGSHYFVASAKQLEQLAYQAGFSYCYVEALGMSHLAVMADQAVELKPYQNQDASICEYYQRKAQSDTLYARTHLGYLLNYHQQALVCAKPIEPVLITEIEQLLKQCFELDLQAPEAFIKRLLETDHLISFGKLMPYSLPFYLTAQAQSQTDWGFKEQVYLELARFICLQGLKTDFQNLFVYHLLLEQIEIALHPFTKLNLDHPLIKELQQVANQLQAKIPELNQVAPKTVAIKKAIKKRTKLKFFRTLEQSFTKLKQQLA
ncbi:class I SAM-dependent methyltransferase [uncultured Thiothrix sp.]|uniref:class I SAM-dependent methyltransferase n=1 Tax=uncultured Thiothrix sp. TaxID=223185 RepID=UPI0026018687|nr:class I SAM-dependent methyltransferase [uncultured Thiothrix sp.]